MLIEDPAIPQVTILVVSLLQLKQKCSVTESHLQGTYRQHRVEKKTTHMVQVWFIWFMWFMWFRQAIITSDSILQVYSRT